MNPIMTNASTRIKSVALSKLKMKPEHYSYLRDLLADIPREQALQHQAKGLGNDKAKRFRWDMYWVAVKNKNGFTDQLDYLLDEHIDSALKRLMVELDYAN